MKPADYMPQHCTTAALIWPAVVAIALSVLSSCGSSQAQESELPLPYPSDTWASPVLSNKPLFEAPPCPNSNETCGQSQSCFDPRAQLLPYSIQDFSSDPFC